MASRDTGIAHALKQSAKMATRAIREFTLARVIAEAALALGSVLLVVAALAADSAWFDRHFLPEHRPRPHLPVLIDSLRVLAVAGAIALAFLVRPRLGRALALGRGTAAAGAVLRALLALALALMTSELLVREFVPMRARRERPSTEEPLRQRDPRLGWVWVTGHRGHTDVGGRRVQYVFDAHGARIPDPASPLDPARPTILFTGESYMLGYGLHWEETVPGQIGPRLGLQTANFAVNSYSVDQAWLRLRDELPRFRRPVAVVSLFASRLFVRALETDRPHLDAQLRWRPARRPWHLQSLAARVVPYHGTAAIERGILMTRRVLQATAAAARERGAVPLILVPRFLPESPVERELRQRVLDEGHLDYVLVDLPSDWRIHGNFHPDARAARVMAETVVARLRRAGLGADPGFSADPGPRKESRPPRDPGSHSRNSRDR